MTDALQDVSSIDEPATARRPRVPRWRVVVCAVAIVLFGAASVVCVRERGAYGSSARDRRGAQHDLAVQRRATDNAGRDLRDAQRNAQGLRAAAATPLATTHDAMSLENALVGKINDSAVAGVGVDDQSVESYNTAVNGGDALSDELGAALDRLEEQLQHIVIPPAATT